MQGAIVDGLSELMAQEITLEKGRVQQGNFDRHPMVRMSQAPAEIEVIWHITEIRPPAQASPPCRRFYRQ